MPELLLNRHSNLTWNCFDSTVAHKVQFMIRELIHREQCFYEMNFGLILFQLSMIDIKNKIFVTVTENLNQRRSMCVTERCTYTATKGLSLTDSKSQLSSEKVIDPKHDVTSSRLSSLKQKYHDLKMPTEVSLRSKLTGEGTLVKREIWVTSQKPGLKSAIESFGKQRYKLNVKRTIAGLVEVLQRLQRESPSL